jgi:hypothetical protein
LKSINFYTFIVKYLKTLEIYKIHTLKNVNRELQHPTEIFVHGLHYPSTLSAVESKILSHWQEESKKTTQQYLSNSFKIEDNEKNMTINRNMRSDQFDKNCEQSKR